MIRDVLFNPAFLSDADAIRQFVVRQELLKPLLDDLEAAYTPINPHTIVIGARGFGKSSLLRRVTAEINTRPELRARWFPVVFPEEPYEVGNLGELWLEALRVVAHTTGDPTITQLREGLHKDRDAERVGRVARDQLRAFAEARGVRLVLVIENLDMLLTDTFSEADAWALRGALQTDPTFFLLASAVRRFEGLTEHDKPFYDGLRRLELEPLNAEEIDTLWGDVSGRAPGVSRAKALRVLTGGNPRMVRLLAQLVHGHRLSDILSELSGLLDRHTDYFKGNIESLTGQQRRVFLAVANLWRPAVAAEIAAEARLDNNVTSVALQRLEHQGRVEVVGLKGKNRLYQVSERLYNIYYLMRRGQGVDARIQAVIDFMVHFYEPPELGGLVTRLLAEPERGGKRPSVDVVCGLVAAHRKNTEARAAVVGALPEEVVEQLPKGELALARRRPKELLALLEGPAGHRFVEDGERMLGRVHHEDPVMDKMAGVVLRRTEGDAPNAAMRLIWFSHEESLRVFDAADTSPVTKMLLAYCACIRALHKGESGFAASWLSRVEQSDDLREYFGDAVSPLRVLSRSPGWEQEVSIAVRWAANSVFALNNLIAACWDNADAQSPLREGLKKLEETPLHLAARVLVCGGHKEEEELKALVEPLTAACRQRGVVCISMAILYETVGQHERARAYVREHQHSFNPIDRLSFVVRARGSEDEIQAAWAACESHWPHNPVLWELLYLNEPDVVFTGWRSLSSTQQTAVAPSLVCGALRSQQRAVWELALTAFEDHILNADMPSDVVFVAWLYGRLGRPDRTLSYLHILLAREDAVIAGERHITELSLALGAVGLGAGVVEAIQRSPHAASLTPLLVALASDAPDLRPAAEELAIAQDLRERMREMAACPDLWGRFTPLPPLPMPTFSLEEFDIPKAKAKAKAKPESKKPRSKPRSKP